jgi:hypothetical protein
MDHLRAESLVTGGVFVRSTSPVGYHIAMRFRLGVALGFAVGYYLGARAGRERYEQLRRGLEKARDSQLLEKARAAVELGVERVRSEPSIDITAAVMEELATS